MFCKQCGNPNVKVGKYCSCCGSLVEPPLGGWTPMKSSTSSKYNQAALQARKEARKEYVNAFLVIAKIAEVILFWPVLLLVAIFSVDWTSEENTHKNRSFNNLRWGSAGTKPCDGDCDNCPPHYGYRYGRWYYGHGHRHGCEKGGNGGSSGRCSKD